MRRVIVPVHRRWASIEVLMALIGVLAIPAVPDYRKVKMACFLDYKWVVCNLE